MNVKRYMVAAVRRDDSTITRTDLHISEATELARVAIEAPEAKRVVIEPQRPDRTYDDAGPVLPLEEALKWRQPDDTLTRLFREVQL